MPRTYLPTLFGLVELLLEYILRNDVKIRQNLSGAQLTEYEAFVPILQNLRIVFGILAPFE